MPFRHRCCENSSPAECPEEITNGGFVGNADGWLTTGDNPLPSNNWAYGDNNVVHNPIGGGGLYQVGFLIEGASYIVNLTIGGSIGTITVYLDGGSSQLFNAGDGDVTFTGTWNEDGGWKIFFQPDGSDFDGTITNVSVKAVSC